MDPLADLFEGWSGYNYALNNPAGMVDPDGLSPCNVGEESTFECVGRVFEATPDDSRASFSDPSESCPGCGLAGGVVFGGVRMASNAMSGRPLTQGVARDFVLGFTIGGTLGLAVPLAAAAMTTTVSTAEVAAAEQGLAIAGSAIPKLGSLADKFGTTGGNIVNQAMTGGTRLTDTLNNGNVNVIIPRLDGASGFIRITLNPEQTRIISAGLQTARMINNGLRSGRFLPIDP